MTKNNLLYKYDSTTSDVKDLTKNHIVKIFDAEVKEIKKRGEILHNLKKGTLLYEYEFTPILNQEEYKRILSMYKSSKLLKELYHKLSLIYSALYADCIKWYIGKSRIQDVFDISKDIEDIRKLKIKNKCCPIINNLNVEDLDDTDIFQWIKLAMNKANLNNIINSEELLYQYKSKKLIKPYNSDGIDVIKKINNIVYKRFLNFLIKKSTKNADDKQNDTYFVLQTSISTKASFEILIKNMFLSEDTKAKDYEAIFTSGQKRINWIGTKKELGRYLFYLDNDCKEEKHLAPCDTIYDKYNIASNIFYIKNIPITEKSLRNSNRKLDKIDKRNALLSAVKALRKRDVIK
ncbi:MAG: hypothetical protein NTZ82_03590 [Bacteroidetes bacterium]|nr:hypothetical protein [Bacteroidota bacterium]